MPTWQIFHKHPSTRRFRELWLMDTPMCQEGGARQLHRTEALTQDPLQPCLRCRFIWLFICILFHVLSHQTVKSKEVLPWVLCAIIANYEAWGRDSWNPWLIIQLVRSTGTIGIWSGDQSCGIEPLPCRICPNSSLLASSLTWRTPNWCQGVDESVGVGKKIHPMWYQGAMNIGKRAFPLGRETFPWIHK